MLFKGITTSMAAIAIAFASFSATPATANSSDTAKIIAGVAALAIIGAAIADSRDDRRQVTRHRGYGHKHAKRYRHHHYGHGYHHRKRHYHHGHRYNHRFRDMSIYRH